MNTVEQIVSTVSAWDGVTAHPHRFGGTEFKLGAVEIGHIHHGSAMVDIPYPRKLREVLVAEGKTGLHHLLPETGWTTLYARTPADAERALWAFRLSYAHKRSRRTKDAALLAAELDTLHASAALRAALGEEEDEAAAE